MYLKLLYLAYKIFCFIFRPVRTGVRVVLLQGNEVMLVRHSYVPGWFLPGGGLKRNETLDQAARREAYEETGAELNDLTLAGVFTSFIQWKTDHAIVFLCRDFKITGRSDNEIAEMRLFALDELPADTFPLHRRLLESYRSGRIPANFGEW